MKKYIFEIKSTGPRPLTDEKEILDVTISIIAENEAEAWQKIQSFCSDPSIIGDNFLPFTVSSVDKVKEI